MLSACFIFLATLNFCKGSGPFSKQVKVTRHVSHFSNNPSCFCTYHLDQEYTTVPDHFVCTPPLLYSCSTPGVQYHLEDISLFLFSYITKFACAEWSSKCHITRLFITEQKTRNQMHQTDRTTYKSIPSFMY